VTSASPTIRQLKYLIAVSETLNFHKAADTLFITQSTLSAGIKELESILGAVLIERNKRSVRLTTIGEKIALRAKVILSGVEDLVAISRQSQKPLTGDIRLGVIPTIAPFLLPIVLPRLKLDYPDLKLYLKEDFSERILDQLNSGELDFALIALPYDTSELTVRELITDEFWFVARQDNPKAKQREIIIKNINPAELLLLEEGHCLRDHTIQACQTNTFNLDNSKMSATSLFTLLQMVDGNLGFTLLPEIVIRAGALVGTNLVARPIEKRNVSRKIALVMRQSGTRSKDFELLADVITEEHRRNTQPKVGGRSTRARN
jgi:LysR family hydrogen peroxide-inducible transcriptional activator